MMGSRTCRCPKLGQPECPRRLNLWPLSSFMYHKLRGWQCGLAGIHFPAFLWLDAAGCLHNEADCRGEQMWKRGSSSIWGWCTPEFFRANQSSMAGTVIMAERLQVRTEAGSVSSWSFAMIWLCHGEEDFVLHMIRSHWSIWAWEWDDPVYASKSSLRFCSFC